jgi:RND family efflux transporter MFP subunit
LGLATVCDSLLIVAATALILGCGGNELIDKAKSREAPRVTVVRPTMRSLVDEDTYNGWLRAYKTVEVRARVRGHIMKVNFQDGDLVKEGQPLFDLDSAPFEADVRQAEAQAKALEAQRWAAQKTVDRKTPLMKQRVVAMEEYEEDVAKLGSIQAQIVAKIAEADRLRLNLKYTHITAPLTGKIGQAELVEGDLVNAGGSDPLLTTIVTIDPIYVDFNVNERAIQRYQNADLGQKGRNRGQPLRAEKISFAFGLDTEKGFPHQGQLVFADNKYREGTGTILVRGVAQNGDGRLIPGSRVRVRIPVSANYEAALVPDAAVNTEQKQKYLLVVDDQKLVKRLNVVPGRLLDDGMRVIIAPKLKADASIIVEGMERVRLNYPAEPVPESTPAAVASAK